MFVTSDTSQHPIGCLLQLPPLAEICKHSSTAFLSSALDFSFRTALLLTDNAVFVVVVQPLVLVLAVVLLLVVMVVGQPIDPFEP